MTKSLLSEDILHVRGIDMIDGPNTPGQPRKTAFETNGLWAGVTTVTAKDTTSQWHHHADFDSVMYVLSGRIRVDWGEHGEKSFEMGPGDFGFYRKGVIHCAQLVGDSESCSFVVVRVGEGETVINTDGPGPNVTTH